MFKLNRAVVAPVAAEFIGAWILVMVALVLGQTTAVSFFIAIALAIAAATVYLLFSEVSGAHANPAVTFGLWTARRIGTLRGMSYVAAQLLGALVAWQLYQYLTNHQLPARTVPFSTPQFTAEAVGAGILVLAYAAALKRGVLAMNSAAAVGAAYFVAILVAATASSGFINPAIALGSRAWSAVYVLGPLAGGLIGANLYIYFFGGTSAQRLATTSTTTTARRKTSRRRTTSQR